MARALPTLPNPAGAAFLLDFDGTLADIASTPEEVTIPDSLPGHLHRLRALCGDAVAIVSGRPIAQIEAFLGDAPFAISGEHGTALRPSPTEPIAWIAIAEPPATWRAHAPEIAARYPGAMLEWKRHGLTLHYRAAPEHGPALRAELRDLLKDADGAYDLLAAKMAWEIRPAGTDKGSAVRQLMQLSPFSGRLPIFLGDDVTDEDGIDAAKDLGGIGLRVADYFTDAAGVRAWLARLAGSDGATWP